MLILHAKIALNAVIYMTVLISIFSLIMES